MLNSSFRYKRLDGGHNVGSSQRFEWVFLLLRTIYGSKSGTDSDYNMEPSIISTISSSFMSKRVVAILYSRNSSCKDYNYMYHKVAGNNF